MSLDMKVFLENRAKTSPGQLAKYRGKFAAWSPDGTRIVASSDGEDELDRLVLAAGEVREDCVVGAVAEMDAVIGGTEVS